MFYDQALLDEHDGNETDTKATMKIITDELNRIYKTLEKDANGNFGIKIDIQPNDPILISDDIPYWHPTLEEYLRGVTWHYT